MQKIDYSCSSCKKDLLSIANLNKHLQTCDKYEDWIKEYKPIYFNCKICLKTYSNEEFLKNHKCD